MAKSLNRVTLIGHVGRDIELKYTPNNVPVASFTVATNERYKDRDGNWQDRAEWHNVVAWQRTAEIANEYLHKGSQVYLEGRLQTRSWDDKQTGEKKYRTEIVISDLVLLGGNGQRNEASGAQENGAGRNPGHAESDQITDEDIPF